MKIRTSYVSNSSSSSYLLPFRPPESVSCIKLTDEMWKKIEKNHVDYEGNKIDLSSSDDWWLTEMISDCSNYFDVLSECKNAIPYLYGDVKPRGWYDCETDYIVLKNREDSFFILVSDFIGNNNEDEIPEAIKMRDQIHEILGSRNLNKTQKLNAISHIVDF